MRAARYANEFVLNPLPFQLLCHLFGLLKRNISILVTVQQKSWWVAFRDVANRAEPLELLGLLVGVHPGHFLRPESVLAAEVVENAAITLSLSRVGHRLMPIEEGIALLGTGKIVVVAPYDDLDSGLASKIKNRIEKLKQDWGPEKAEVWNAGKIAAHPGPVKTREWALIYGTK